MALTAAVALGSGAALADDTSPFHCDGTDLALFLERQEAGWVGYGETWDHDTCGEGEQVYAPGSTQWSDMRPKWSLAMAPKFDVELYSKVFPAVAFGSLAFIFGVAWLMAFVQRRRKVHTVTQACPSCEMKVTVTLDDPAAHGMFCPACGTPTVAVEEGASGAALASASS